MHFMTFRCLRFLKLQKSNFCLLVALADILFMLHAKMKPLLFKWIIFWVLSSWDPANMSSCASLFDFIHIAQDVQVCTWAAQRQMHLCSGWNKLKWELQLNSSLEL